MTDPERIQALEDEVEALEDEATTLENDKIRLEQDLAEAMDENESLKGVLRDVSFALMKQREAIEAAVRST